MNSFPHEIKTYRFNKMEKYIDFNKMITIRWKVVT